MPKDDYTKLHERIATLETNVGTIMTNHLPHIQKKVDEIDIKINQTNLTMDEKIDKIINKINKVFIWLIIITGLVLIHLGEGTNLVMKLLSII